MTKWICNKCMVGNPCSLDFIGTATPAKICPFTGTNLAEWKTEQKPKPKTELPDWCKVLEWVWLDPQKITGANGYEKVTNVDGLGLMFESGLMVRFSHRILQARLRPYNAEEMKALVGKVLEHDGNASLVIVYLENGLLRVGTKWVSAERLIEDGYTIDGKPCGKFEHLNNAGEWVE